MDIPCHPRFVKDRVVLNKDFIKDFIKEHRSQVSERQERILLMIVDDETLTSQKIAQKTKVSQRTIMNYLTKLQALGILAREGGRKDGTWVIVTQ
jgi:ATP-dependent DNA helicase RecG